MILPASAGQSFSPGRFTYNPETMTRLDWAHEWRHFKQLQQAQSRGIKLNSQAFRAMEGPGEIGAYSYEKALWERAGLRPSDEYLSWHSDRIGSYADQSRAFRSMVAKPYGQIYRGIRW